MNRYLLMDIGCIECGASSDVVGLYSTEQEAELLAGALNKNCDFHDGGQHSFEVFDLQAPRDAKYEEMLSVARAAQAVLP